MEEETNSNLHVITRFLSGISNIKIVVIDRTIFLGVRVNHTSCFDCFQEFFPVQTLRQKRKAFWEGKKSVRSFVFLFSFPELSFFLSSLKFASGAIC